MRFRILGPLEVFDDNGRLLTVGGPQLRGLLGVLLLNADRVVSVERLVEHLWGDQPPPTARGLLQGRVAHLRRAIDQGHRQPLVTRGQGYVLDVREGELDVADFDALVRRAGIRPVQEQQSPQALADRSELLNEALALWRGHVLDGVPLDSWQAEVRHLEERRLTVLEQRVELDLELGRHASIVGELQAELHLHPLRERLWALLLLALAGAGRSADALTAYRQLRSTVREQLGAEPSEAVQEIHQRILTGDIAPVGLVAPRKNDDLPVRVATSQQPAPAQLPASTVAFTGRTAELTWLDELLHLNGDRATIGVVSGTAGVGKTTLAVKWAHKVRPKFPDGQLYVNLRGYASAPPLRPIDALAGFLQALGMPGEQIPGDPQLAAERYRSVLTGRRVLIVLDNARNAEQVRPLLPEAKGCLVLITSRDQLPGLVTRESARHHRLDVLRPTEASALLARLLGQERVAAEPLAAAELAQQCALLPLALRVAAANLSFPVAGSIADQVANLATGSRLDALQTGDDESSAVRAAIDLSYAALDSRTQRLFRRLGLSPGSDVTPGTAAALVGVTEAQAQALLDRLASANLLDQTGSGRYAFHDLLRLYARERAEAEEPEAERTLAIDRLTRWYVDVVDAAARLLYPQVLRLHVPPVPAYAHQSTGAALTWLDTERANLVATASHAHAIGLDEPAALLADALRGYLFLRRNVVDWQVLGELGLAAGVATGDLVAQAAGHFSLGMAQLCSNNYWQALSHQRRALDLSRQADWKEGQSNALGNLALVHQKLGELDLAAERHTEALALNQACDSERGVSVNLYNLGQLNILRGRLADAHEQLEEATNRPDQANDSNSRAVGANRLGELYHSLGRFDDALKSLADSLALHRRIGNVHGQGIAHGSLAAVHADAGRLTTALDHASQSYALLQGSRDRDTEAFACNRRGLVLTLLGQPGEAIELHTKALQLAREIAARYPESEALICLADAYRASGQLDEAHECAARALALTQRIGYRILEGKARVALAAARLQVGEVADALDQATLAAELHTETGHQLGAARALLVQGHAHQLAGDQGAAGTVWRRALATFSELGTPEAKQVAALLA